MRRQKNGHTVNPLSAGIKRFTPDDSRHAKDRLDGRLLTSKHDPSPFHARSLGFTPGFLRHPTATATGPLVAEEAADNKRGIAIPRLHYMVELLDGSHLTPCRGAPRDRHRVASADFWAMIKAID